MKLTKGKISKLYNKKKQTLKRKTNKGKGSNKNKTFRRKRHINLARKSLKRIHYRKQKGGEEEMPKDNTNNATTDVVIPETPNEDLIIPDNTSTDLVISETPNEDVVIPDNTSTDVAVSETSSEDVVLPETPGEDLIVPDSNTTDVVLPETPSEDLIVPDSNTTDVVLPETPSEDLIVPETTSEDVVVPETPIEDVIVPETEISSPLAGTPAVLIENNKPIDQEDVVKDKVKDALNAVVDYISDKVSEKVSPNGKIYTEGNIQNGFDSVNIAAEKMALSGGSKKRKTRKFRIQKQKRTTHHKTKKHIGGGEWLNSKDEAVVENVSCPICLENFLDTPNQAIYKSDCGHIFHNDCVLRVCEGPIEKRICPMCRTPLKDDCSDVYAFRNKAMASQDDDDENAPVFEDEEIQTIYENQR